MRGKKNDIKYIEEFWTNIEEFSKTVEVLSANFEYYFLNDFLDNYKKWKKEIDLINEDLYDHYKSLNVNINSNEDINITFDIFIKNFLSIGKNYINNNKRLLAIDMQNIIQDVIVKHIKKLNIQVDEYVKPKSLSQNISKLQVFY